MTYRHSPLRRQPSALHEVRWDDSHKTLEITCGDAATATHAQQMLSMLMRKIHCRVRGIEFTAKAAESKALDLTPIEQRGTTLTLHGVPPEAVVLVLIDLPHIHVVSDTANAWQNRACPASTIREGREEILGVIERFGLTETLHSMAEAVSDRVAARG